MWADIPGQRLTGHQHCLQNGWDDLTGLAGLSTKHPLTRGTTYQPPTSFVTNKKANAYLGATQEAAELRPREALLAGGPGLTPVTLQLSSSQGGRVASIVMNLNVSDAKRSPLSTPRAELGSTCKLTHTPLWFESEISSRKFTFGALYFLARCIILKIMEVLGRGPGR